MEKSKAKVINRHNDDDLDFDALLGEEPELSGNSGTSKKTKKPITKQQKVSKPVQIVELDDLDDRGFKIKLVSLPISLVKFNFRNKRVTTQLVRFVPDNVIEEMIARYPDSVKEQQAFIEDSINRIPKNTAVSELRGNSSQTRLTSIQKANEEEKKQYPCHDDLYDWENEGVFIGKGVCFSNIVTSNKQLQEEIDSFLDAVHRNGKSVAKNGDVVEKPIVYANGSNFILKSGHLRLCYLTFAFGRQFQYDFIQSDKVDENLHIYLENNAKHEETAYERILSYYHTIKEQNLFDKEGRPDEDAIKTALAIGRSRYFQIINFINNPKLIDVVKRNAVGQKLSTILSKLYSAKKLYDDTTKDYQIDTPFEVFWEEQFKIVPEKKLSTVSVKLPDSGAVIKKLLFSDVKSWSKLDFSEYNLNKKTDIHKLINDLANEAASDNK
jgi:hypothetical protein